MKLMDEIEARVREGKLMKWVINEVRRYMDNAPKKGNTDKANNKKDQVEGDKSITNRESHNIWWPAH